jgi:hypothetical protein
MNSDIKNILDEQISQQTIKPSINDIVEYSCLFTYNDSGLLEHKAHEKCCNQRIIELLTVLNNINIKNTSFILYTHDYTKDYIDNTKYTLCFGKKKNQSFITIPNNHLIKGTVDYFLNEVRCNDITTDKKLNQSIFIGGPNGGINGPRSEYAFSCIDNLKHKIIITNVPIFNIKEQLKFRYLINIDGNGACYDRLYWQLASNSVPVYLQKNTDIIQLHDLLLLPDVHYLEYDIHTWHSKFDTLEQRHNINSVIENGKDFIKKHFGISAKNKCIEIIKYTLEQISRKQNEN